MVLTGVCLCRILGRSVCPSEAHHWPNSTGIHVFGYMRYDISYMVRGYRVRSKNHTDTISPVDRSLYNSLVFLFDLSLPKTHTAPVTFDEQCSLSISHVYTWLTAITDVLARQRLGNNPTLGFPRENWQISWTFPRFPELNYLSPIITL